MGGKPLSSEVCAIQHTVVNTFLYTILDTGQNYGTATSLGGKSERVAP